MVHGTEQAALAPVRRGFDGPSQLEPAAPLHDAVSDDDDYIPESLRQFVAQAQMTQESVLSLISDEMSGEEIEKAITEDYDAALIDLPPPLPAPLVPRSSINQPTQPSTKRTAQGVPLPIGSDAAGSKRSNGARVGVALRSKKVGSNSNASHLRRLLSSSSSKLGNQQQQRRQQQLQNRLNSTGHHQHPPSSVAVQQSARLAMNSEPPQDAQTNLAEATPEIGVSDRETKKFPKKLNAMLSPPLTPPKSRSGESSPGPISSVTGTLSLPHIVTPIPADAPLRAGAMDPPSSPDATGSRDAVDPAAAPDPSADDWGGMSEDEVPESLRSLFEQADQALRQTQQEILEVASESSTTIEITKSRFITVMSRVPVSPLSEQLEQTKGHHPMPRGSGKIEVSKAREVQCSHCCGDDTDSATRPAYNSVRGDDRLGGESSRQVDVEEILSIYAGKMEIDGDQSPIGGSMSDSPLSETKESHQGETLYGALSRELDPILVPVARCYEELPRWDAAVRIDDFRPHSSELRFRRSTNEASDHVKIDAGSRSLVEVELTKTNEIGDEFPLKRQWMSGVTDLATTVESHLSPNFKCEGDLEDKFMSDGIAAEHHLCDPSMTPAVCGAKRLESQRFATEECSQDTKIEVPNPRLDCGCLKSASRSDDAILFIPSATKLNFALSTESNLLAPTHLLATPDGVNASPDHSVTMSTEPILLAPMHLREIPDSFKVIHSPSDRAVSAPEAMNSADSHGEEIRHSMHSSSSLLDPTDSVTSRVKTITLHPTSEPSKETGDVLAPVAVSLEAGQERVSPSETLLSVMDSPATVSLSLETEDQRVDYTNAVGLREVKPCDGSLERVPVVEADLNPIRAETELKVSLAEQCSRNVLSEPVLEERHEEEEVALTKLQTTSYCKPSENPHASHYFTASGTAGLEPLLNHQDHITLRDHTIKLRADSEDGPERNAEEEPVAGIYGISSKRIAHDHPAKSTLLEPYHQLHLLSCSSSGLGVAVNANDFANGLSSSCSMKASENVILHASPCSSEDRHIASYVPACCSPVQEPSQCSHDEPTDMHETDSEESSLRQPPSIVQVPPRTLEAVLSSSHPPDKVQIRKHALDDCLLTSEMESPPEDCRVNDQVSSTLTESHSGSADPTASMTEDKRGASPTSSSYPLSTFEENEIVEKSVSENSPNDFCPDSPLFGADFLSASLLAFVKSADEVLSRKQTDFLCCGQGQLCSVASYDPGDNDTTDASQSLEPPISKQRMFKGMSADDSTIPVEGLLKRERESHERTHHEPSDQAQWTVSTSHCNEKVDDVKSSVCHSVPEKATVTPQEPKKFRDQPFQTSDSARSTPKSADALVAVDSCVRMELNDEVHVAVEACGQVGNQNPPASDYGYLGIIQAREASIAWHVLEAVLEVDSCIEMSLDEASSVRCEVDGTVNDEEPAVSHPCPEVTFPGSRETLQEDDFCVGMFLKDESVPCTEVVETLVPESTCTGALLGHQPGESGKINAVESQESSHCWTEPGNVLYSEMISAEICIEPRDASGEAYINRNSVCETSTNAEASRPFKEPGSKLDQPLTVKTIRQRFVDEADDNEFVNEGRTGGHFSLLVEGSLLAIDCDCSQKLAACPVDCQSFRTVEALSSHINGTRSGEEIAEVSEIPFPPSEATNADVSCSVDAKEMHACSPEASELGTAPSFTEDSTARKSTVLSIDTTADTALSSNEASEDSSWKADVTRDGKKFEVSVDNSTALPSLSTQDTVTPTDAAHCQHASPDDSCSAQSNCVASNDRSKQASHSPRHWKSSNQRRVEEARAKAVERIRQRKLKEFHSIKEAHETEASKTVSKKATYSPEEGVARAKRRMKAFREAELANAAGSRKQSKCAQRESVTPRRIMSQCSQSGREHAQMECIASSKTRQSTQPESSNENRPGSQRGRGSTLARQVQTRSSFITAPKRTASRCFGRNSDFRSPIQLKATLGIMSSEIITARSVDEAKRDSRTADSVDSDLQPSKTFPSYMKPTKSSDLRREHESCVPRTHEASMAASSRVLQSMLRSDRPVVMNTGLWKWYARPLAPRKAKPTQTSSVDYEAR